MPEVFICQHRTCAKDGAGQVLKAFREQPVAGVVVIACGCLGLCGSGPIVLIADEQVYYWHIKPRDVPKIINNHLKEGKVIKSLLHRRLHGEEFS